MVAFAERIEEQRALVLLGEVKLYPIDTVDQLEHNEWPQEPIIQLVCQRNQAYGSHHF